MTDVINEMTALKLEDCFEEEDDVLKCKFCPGIYKKKGNLKTHIESKHEKKIDLSCHCGKVFTDTTKLGRHLKSCK